MSFLDYYLLTSYMNDPGSRENPFFTIFWICVQGPNVWVLLLITFQLPNRRYLRVRANKNRVETRILILPHWFSWFFSNYIFFSVKKATYFYSLYSFYTVTGDLFTFGLQSHPLNFERLESCTFKKCHIFVILMQFL